MRLSAIIGSAGDGIPNIYVTSELDKMALGIVQSKTRLSVWLRQGKLLGGKNLL